MRKNHYNRNGGIGNVDEDKVKKDCIYIQYSAVKIIVSKIVTAEYWI